MTNNKRKQINTMNYNDVTKVTNTKALNELKSKFDRDYHNQLDKLKTLEYAGSMRDKPFGFIKEAIEAMSGELFRSKEGRAILNKYIACVKENKELKKMHLLRECVRKANKNTDINSYLNEAIAMIGRVNTKDAKVQSRKAGDILAEACIQLGKYRSELIIDKLSFNDSLNEAIEYIETHSKKPSTLANFSDCTNLIKESVALNEAVSKVAMNTLTDATIEQAINEFNEKYGDQLDEDGKKLVKQLSESTNKEELFDKYKSDCITKLNEKKTLFEGQGDKLTSERLELVLEKINQRTYNAETVNEDILNLIEMTNSL